MYVAYPRTVKLPRAKTRLLEFILSFCTKSIFQNTSHEVDGVARLLSDIVHVLSPFGRKRISVGFWFDGLT